MAITFRQATITAVLLAPAIVAGAVYVGLVNDGTVPPPDFRGIAQAVIPAATGSLSIALGLAIIVTVICTAIAPIIYAVRSADILTVLVSLVLTTVAIAIFVTAKTSIQEILAVLIYLANTVLSATIYAAHHIARSQ